jgi:uncharacterized protein YndB with AHSA1/START domain
MAIKQDGAGKRWVDREVLVPGTPEQVWQAVATGEGNSAWFTRAQIDARVGGSLRFDFGPGMTSTGQVTFWEPPHRFGYVEREWNEGAPPVATEIVITGRNDGQCVVRMVHSLFSSTDDWDGELEGFETGWPGFFEVLRIYLGHFPGMPGDSFQVMVPGLEEDSLAVWRRLIDLLGVAGVNVGEHHTVTGPEAPLTGVVEHVAQTRKVRMILLRLEAPTNGVALAGTYETAGGVHASLSVFCYGDGVSQRVRELAGPWDEWLRRQLTAADG